MRRELVAMLVVALGVLSACTAGVAAVDTATDGATVSDGTTAGHAFTLTITEVDGGVESDPVAVTVAVENVGEAAGEEAVELTVPGIGTNSTTVSLAPSESTTLDLSVDTDIEDAAGSPYTLSVTTAGDGAVADVTLRLPDLVGSPPADLDGDGRYEDTDGDGRFSIFDVQAFFETYRGAVVDTHSWAFDFDDSGDVTITDVQAQFDALDAGIERSATFEPTLTDVPDEVSPGEGLTVEYAVENTGEQTGTQTVTVYVDGRDEATTALTVGPGDSTTETFSYPVGVAELPSASVAVSTEDRTVSQAVPVVRSEFAVTTLDAPDGVEAGEDIAVGYTVENVGTADDTQDIELAVNGTVANSTAATLDPGETTSGTLTYTTDPGDAPAVTVAVSTDDDTESSTVSVAGAQFDVTAFDAPAEVQPGADITVNYTVENTGTTGDTQTVDFLVDGDTENSDTATLGPGATTNGTFTYTTGESDGTSVTVTVATEDDTVSQDVPLVESVFAVTSVDAPDAVTAGEDLAVNYTVENTGAAEDTQEVALLVDGSTEANVTVTLGPGEETSGALTYTTAEADAPNVTATVSTDTDTNSTVVDVLDGEFAVTTLDAPDSVAAGDPITVGYTVENVGTAEDTQTVAFLVDGGVADSNTTTLGPGETASGSFGYTTDETDLPNVTVAVSTDDDSAGQTVPVLDGEFVVTSVDAPDAVTTGEDIAVGYTVENVGDAEDTQTVAFLVDGGTVDSNTTMLGPGGTASGIFTYATSGADTPSVTVAVSTDDDSAGQTVTVGAGEFAVTSFAATPDPVAAGEDIAAEYTVENVGPVEATQTVAFLVNGGTADSNTTTLGPGATASGTFTYTTSGADTPSVTVAVSTENDSVEQTVTVGEGEFAVTSFAATPNPVSAGEDITAEYTVENVGPVEATQTVEFLVNGSVTDTDPDVTLGPGATTSGTFTYATAEADAPAVTVAVSTDNETASAEVAVEFVDFQVDSVETNTPVVEGNPLLVTANITNTGNTQATQTVTLDAGSLGSNTTEETLSPGATRTVSLSVDTASGDAGNYTATVSTDDDSGDAAVTVVTPDVTVTLNETQGAVGETVTLELDVLSAGGGPTSVEAYSFALVYDESVLNFTGVSGGDFDDPDNVNDDPAGANLTVNGFLQQEQTPVDPGLVFTFEILSNGSTPVEFVTDDSEVAGGGTSYSVQYDGGAAGTSVNAAGVLNCCRIQ